MRKSVQGFGAVVGSGGGSMSMVVVVTIMMIFPGRSGVAGQEGVSTGGAVGGGFECLQQCVGRAVGNVTGRSQGGGKAALEVSLGAGTLRIRIVRSGAGRLEREKKTTGQGLSGDRDWESRLKGLSWRYHVWRLVTSLGGLQEGPFTGGAQRSEDRGNGLCPLPVRPNLGLG